MSGTVLLPPDQGQVIGLKFHAGAWYRYSSALDGWGRCDPVTAERIAAEIAALVSAVPLDPCLQIEGGSHVTH